MNVPEPLDVSMLTGRVMFAAFALLHTMFATFIVGSTLIGALTDTFGAALKRAWLDRLAYMIAFALVLSTGFVSFLGVVMVFLLNVYWPRFWHALFEVMFWPFLGEAGFFLGEVIFTYSWYYLWAWRSTGRRGLHLSFIWLAAACSLIAMFMIDITASYMLTPRPVDSAWANVFNPTMLHLHVHRWFGNVTWAGFGLAALCAIGSIRAGRQEDRAHFSRGGAYCFLFGFGALLLMPIVGYEYLLSIRYAQPQAFHTLMLGERSWLFDLVAFLFGLLIVVGSVYVCRLTTLTAPATPALRAFAFVSIPILLGATIVFGMPYHLQHVPLLHQLTDQHVNPVGKMQPTKYVAAAALITFGFVYWIYFLRLCLRHLWRTDAPAAAAIAPHRQAAVMLITLAACSALVYLTMGWVRETARAYNGYLIYGHYRLIDERPTYEDAQPGPARTPLPEGPDHGS